LSVLIVVADGGPEAAQVAAALAGHFVLVCGSADQALAVGPQFRPDVALIDTRLPDWRGLAAGLAGRTDGPPLALVALVPAGAAGPTPAGFRHQLPLPITSPELMELFRQLQPDPTPRRLGQAV
jgi:CheY-like chemotaxis protein